MNVVGIDGHKKTHTLVVVDPVGRRIAQLTVSALPLVMRVPASGSGSSARCWWPSRIAAT